MGILICLKTTLISIIDNSVRINRFSTELIESGYQCRFGGMITSAQCRAARGLLDWSQQELSKRAGIGVVTLRQLEAGTHDPRRSTLDVVRRCLEAAGVEFIDENNSGPGVRLRKPDQTVKRK